MNVITYEFSLKNSNLECQDALKLNTIRRKRSEHLALKVLIRIVLIV